MENFLPFSTKPINDGASTSTGNTYKYNLVRNENSKIGIQNFPSAEVVHMPITAGDNAVFNISTKVEQETTKTFPVKYHILDLEESFRGRDAELSDLKTYLLPDDTDKTKSTMAVISGLPGIGKTEMARKFALDFQNNFSGNILWISAETQDYLKKSFISIARLLKMNIALVNDFKIIVDKVYSYFENTSCLFVFDNAENMRDIKDYLPSKSLHSNVKYSILITSTEKIWGSNIPVVTLPELPLDAAVDVCKTIIGETNFNSEMKLEKVVQFVDRIPLGIQIISHLILNEIHLATEIMVTFSLTEFLKVLEDEMLLDETFPQYSRNSYTKSIFIAIKLAIKKIETCGSIQALDVLHIAAYLSPDYINTKLFLLLPDLHQSKPILNKALAVLSKFFLIRVNSDIIIIHRLVQKTICLYQERELDQKNYVTATLNLLYDPLTACQVAPIHRHYIFKHKNCIQWCIDYYTRTKSQLFLYTLVEGGNDKILSEIIKNLPENEKVNLLSDPVLLQKATQRQDESMVEFLLDHGASVKQNGEPLIYAFENENWEAALVLLQNGCDVNARDVLGEPPLFRLFVVLAGEYTKPILELLLTQGADIFARNDDQETILHICAYDPVLEFIKYLFERTEITKYINEKDVNGFTPLHRLFTEHIGDFTNVNRVIEIFEYLTQKGANPSLKTNKNDTLLHIAVATTSLKLVEYIIKCMPGIVNEVDVKGKTALHKILSSEENDVYREKIAKHLIDNGSDLNVVDNKGKTILHSATKYFRPTILKYILQKENNINLSAQDLNGYTILHNWLKLNKTDDHPNYNNVMMENDCKELIEFILYLKDSSFDFSLKTKANETLLHVAATKGNLKLLQTILDIIFEVIKNYDINTQDKMGRSVLHWLLHNTYYENDAKQVQSCFKYLIIQHGANINLENANKQTVLHLCATVLDNKLIELILSDEMNFNKLNSQDIDGNTALHNVCDSNTMYTGLKYDANVKCVNVLLDYGTNINIHNNINETALHLAVNQNKYTLIKAIIEHPNYNFDNINNSIIDQMLFNLVKSIDKGSNFEDVENIKDFIKMGANLNVINEKQQNLLHIIASKGNLKVIKFICEHKQYTNKINLQDTNGNTPLHYFLKNEITCDPRLLNWENHVDNILNSIEYLVNSKKGDLTIKNYNQQTVLHFAVARNVLSIVKFVVETCKKNPTFNINDQDEVGNTVLHYLFRYKNVPDAEDVFEQEFFAVLSYLLSNQANPTIANKENKTPSQLACENNLNNIARFLDEYVETNNLNTMQQSPSKKCTLM